MASTSGMARRYSRLPASVRGDARADPIEQRGLELVLELADVERHARLAEPEVVGGARKALEPRGVAKRPELAQPVALVVDALPVDRQAQQAPGRRSSMTRMNHCAASARRLSRRVSTP